MLLLLLLRLGLRRYVAGAGGCGDRRILDAVADAGWPDRAVWIAGRFRQPQAQRVLGELLQHGPVGRWW
uniref:Putative secreted protein n=1 Tax=Anopheles triannulatus TaxID=58253 RepID=A0A2M4B2X0_9DIPT